MDGQNIEGAKFALLTILLSQLGRGGFRDGAPDVNKLTRNQRLILEFERGYTVEELMGFYGLSHDRIHAILWDEKNRRLVSPLSFYRNLRANQQEASTASS